MVTYRWEILLLSLCTGGWLKSEIFPVLFETHKCHKLINNRMLAILITIVILETCVSNIIRIKDTILIFISNYNNVEVANTQ